MSQTTLSALAGGSHAISDEVEARFGAKLTRNNEQLLATSGCASSRPATRSGRPSAQTRSVFFGAGPAIGVPGFLRLCAGTSLGRRRRTWVEPKRFDARIDSAGLRGWSRLKACPPRGRKVVAMDRRVTISTAVLRGTYDVPEGGIEWGSIRRLRPSAPRQPRGATERGEAVC